MGRQAKKYSAQFKFKVVLESFQAESVAEVARRYGVHPNQLSMWRKQFQESGPKLFEVGKDGEAVAQKKRIAQLENLIGKKELEISLLKNFVDFYVPLDGP